MADSKARLLAKLLDASGDVVSSGLDNVPASDDASALTTGTLPAARIASGAITNVKLGTDISADKITTGTLPAGRYTDTNTTYAVGDGGLSEKNFTTTLNTKLGNIATSANNYSHPTGAGNNHIPSGGASANVLTYSSSGTAVWAAPAGGGGGGGAMVFLGSITASGASSVDFDTQIDTTYDDYVIICTALNASASGKDLYARAKTGGSWNSSATYYYHTATNTTSGSGYSNEYAGGETIFLLAPTGAIASGAADGFHVTVYLDDVHGTAMNQIRFSSGKSLNTGKGGGGYGHMNTASNVQGFQFFLNSGTLTGKFKIYGIAKA